MARTERKTAVAEENVRPLATSPLRNARRRNSESFSARAALRDLYPVAAARRHHRDGTKSLSLRAHNILYLRAKCAYSTRSSF